MNNVSIPAVIWTITSLFSLLFTILLIAYRIDIVRALDQSKIAGDVLWLSEIHLRDDVLWAVISALCVLAGGLAITRIGSGVGAVLWVMIVISILIMVRSWAKWFSYRKLYRREITRQRTEEQERAQRSARTNYEEGS